MRTRHGFTLMEIMVVVAILLALAAVLLPQVANRARTATGTAVLSTSATLADAIAQFKADTRRYPAELRWLVSTTDGSPTDICGTPIPPGLLARWAGPYIQQHVRTAGVPAGDAVILNTVIREHAQSTTVSSAILTSVGVTRDLASDIEGQMDGDADFTSGTIRWAPGGTDPDTLKYYIPIRGC